MPKKSEKIIIDVVPITRIPLSRNQSFSYLSDTEIGAGSLVSVPLFRRKVEGIVTGNRPACNASRSDTGRPDFARLGNIELKKVSSLIEEKFLDKKQIALAEFISNYYFSPLGVVLKSFIPNRVKPRNKPEKTSAPTHTKKIVLTKEQQGAISKIAKNNNNKFLLFGPAGSGKTEIYIGSIKQLKKNKQVLILLPELMLAPQAIERYSAQFGKENISVLNSKVSKGGYYKEWQRIKSGESKVIIGTRMAVFAPFKNLGLIVVDEEQDMSFKQWDMNPRYDARTVAEKLAEIHKARIIFGSATPSIESYQKTTAKELELIELPPLKIPGQLKKNYDYPEVVIVDLKKERWEHNQSPISKKLRAEIAYALKNNLQTILFINRQGMSNFSICANCKTVLRCPKCERALIYDTSGIYKCVHCAYRTSVTPECSRCKGIVFQNIGLGTQKIEKEITGFFPAARVARADNQTMRGAGAQEKIYRDFTEGKIDILIGTQVLTKGWDLPNVSLVGIIDADNMLSIPDFSANIKAFQNIVQVGGRSNRPGALFRGIVILQTFDPNQKLFQLAAERNFKQFFEQELKERKDLRLPPFGKLIKLIFQHYDPNKVSAETLAIYEKLTAHKSKDTNITEPQDSFLPNVRGRYRKQIIIKIKNKSLIPEKLRQILFNLPAGWIIDVDPISII